MKLTEKNKLEWELKQTEELQDYLRNKAEELIECKRPNMIMLRNHIRGWIEELEVRRDWIKGEIWDEEIKEEAEQEELRSIEAEEQARIETLDRLLQQALSKSTYGGRGKHEKKEAGAA